MKCALIGEKLGHSFSKDIHEKLGRYSYELVELAPGDLEGFLRSGCFDGLNVTIPYKQSVIPFLDEVSVLASEIGAVNTIVRKDGRLSGYNTDFGGMKLLIERLGADLQGRKVFISGSGGTSRTAERVCRELGAAEVIRTSRSGRNGAITYEEAYSLHGDASVLINTTPAGMFPDIDGMPVSLDRLKQLEGVVDVIYNPLSTRLAIEARDRGIPAVNGLYMLAAQAMLAAEIFTGEPVDSSAAECIYRELSREKRNIVLTGMPGSGKSTLGRLLAAKTGRELIETDEEIVKEAGMPVPEIFSKYGEPYFRDLESSIIKRASGTGGRIISTGGGAVLRKENADHLRMNGTIVFLDRAVEDLIPTDDRPLARSEDQIRSLYAERYPVYRKTADVTVPIEGTEEESADRIWRAVL